MTIEVCKDYCRNMGWAIAGTESSNQCFCGNEAPTITGEEGQCNAPCSGNSQQICGGEWAMHIYHLIGKFINLTPQARSSEFNIIRKLKNVP